MNYRKILKRVLPFYVVFALLLVSISASASGGITPQGSPDLGGAMGPKSDSTSYCWNWGCSTQRSVTAIRQQDGNLKLIGYQTTNIADVDITRGSTNTAGSIGSNNEIALTSVPPVPVYDGSSFVVSAIEDGGGDLMLIAWATGSLTRMGDNVLSGFPGEGIQEVALTTVSYAGSGGTMEGRLVTAVRTSDNHLRLIAWDVQPKVGGGKDIVRLGDLTFGDATQIAVTSIGTNSDPRVVVAFRNSSGNLMLKVVDISAGGNLTERDSFTSGAVTRVAVRPIRNNTYESICNGCVTLVSATAGVVTAVRNSDGELLLTRWSVADNGQISWLTNSSGETTGAVKEIGLTQTGDIVTAIRGGTGKLKLIEWSAPPRMVGESWEITRTDDSASTDDLAASSDVSVTRIGQSGHNLIVTSRLASGDLKVTMWEK